MVSSAREGTMAKRITRARAVLRQAGADAGFSVTISANATPPNGGIAADGRASHLPGVTKHLYSERSELDSSLTYSGPGVQLWSLYAYTRSAAGGRV